MLWNIRQCSRVNEFEKRARKRKKLPARPLLVLCCLFPHWSRSPYSTGTVALFGFPKGIRGTKELILNAGVPLISKLCVNLLFV